MASEQTTAAAAAAAAATAASDDAAPPPASAHLSLPHGLLLRPYQPTDAPSLALVMDNPRIHANMRDVIPKPYTLADAEEWIRRCGDPANWASTNTFATDGSGTEFVRPKVPCNYVIVLPAAAAATHEGQQQQVGDEVVGGIGLLPGADVHRRTAELGYWLGESWWGRGIMSAVVPVFCAWAWEAMPGLLRIHADTYAANAASQRVLAKAGFVFEGRQKAAVFKLGKVGDILVFALIREGV